MTPCVDGLETKSQPSNSKSSPTLTLPLPIGSTEPIPLEDIPKRIFALSNSFNMLPDGVGSISTVPTKSSPSQCISFTL